MFLDVITLEVLDILAFIGKVSISIILVILAVWLYVFFMDRMPPLE